MSRSKSSNQWLNEHFSDQYVKQSKSDGFRSRASYKLLEINEKDRLFRPGLCVLDLGAAPGGWTQVASQLVGEKGVVFASDILPMDSLAGVEFIQGDFTEQSVYDELMATLGEYGHSGVDLVISDMAPNMSGMTDIDQPAAMHLVELALDMACSVLKPNGNFVAKVFQGEGFDNYLRDLREKFSKVVTRKPGASRARSRECYLVGKGFRG
ncbi:23S rRNA (uridine(2552)-2'-O)-methyltransferase RlmE [Halioxenophilus aromaticivorans]|uniref:Ribosomal RNA large subunit methyltransferase E n=1 Tax=Halioxenophilus aromaticivorans TaxID=1306992 RepID=A0AAV3U905_9ALTE